MKIHKLSLFDWFEKLSFRFDLDFKLINFLIDQYKLGLVVTVFLYFLGSIIRLFFFNKGNKDLELLIIKIVLLPLGVIAVLSLLGECYIVIINGEINFTMMVLPISFLLLIEYTIYRHKENISNRDAKK